MIALAGAALQAAMRLISWAAEDSHAHNAFPVRRQAQNMSWKEDGRHIKKRNIELEPLAGGRGDQLCAWGADCVLPLAAKSQAMSTEPGWAKAGKKIRPLGTPLELLQKKET